MLVKYIIYAPALIKLAYCTFNLVSHVRSWLMLWAAARTGAYRFSTVWQILIWFLFFIERFKMDYISCHSRQTEVSVPTAQEVTFLTSRRNATIYMLHSITKEDDTKLYAYKADTGQFAVVTNLSSHRPTTPISPTEVAPKPEGPRGSVSCSGHARAGQVSECVCVSVWVGAVIHLSCTILLKPCKRCK